MHCLAVGDAYSATATVSTWVVTIKHVWVTYLARTRAINKAMTTFSPQTRSTASVEDVRVNGFLRWRRGSLQSTFNWGRSR